MQLDVVIDVVCPWCYVGKKQLDKALEMRPGVISTLQWRPFQLAPNTPAVGVDRTEHYKKKFGDSPQFLAARENLRQQGKTLGIDFDFESKCQIANTLDAHRLIRWSYTAGVQQDVVEDIMRRYFVDSAFIGSHDLLTDVAQKAGMDGDLVQELLASDKDVDAVRHEVAEANRMGVQGVPMFIFNGKTGVSGAQPADVLVNVMDQLLQNAAAE